MEAEKYQKKRGVVVFAPTQNYSSWEEKKRDREGEREDMRATDENGGCW